MNLAETGRGANNVLSQITSDALEIAKKSDKTTEVADAPVVDSQDAVKKMIAAAKKRGYITYDALNKALPPELSSEQIEDVMTMLSEMGINVINNADWVSVGSYDFDQTSYEQLKIWSQSIILNGKLGCEIEDIVDCIAKSMSEYGVQNATMVG